MPLETEKRNLLIFFALLACILIGTQLFSYRKLAGNHSIRETSLTGAHGYAKMKPSRESSANLIRD